MSSTLRRRLLKSTLLTLVSQLNNCVEKPSDVHPKFRLSLYLLLLEVPFCSGKYFVTCSYIIVCAHSQCLKDDQEWSEGVNWSWTCLTKLPYDLRRPIWAYRVSFLSKQQGQRVDVSQLVK